MEKKESEKMAKKDKPEECQKLAIEIRSGCVMN